MKVAFFSLLLVFMVSCKSQETQPALDVSGVAGLSYSEFCEIMNVPFPEEYSYLDTSEPIADELASRKCFFKDEIVVAFNHKNEMIWIKKEEDVLFSNKKKQKKMPGIQ